MNSNFELDFYDFDLPEHLIAKVPLSSRDASRLLLVEIYKNQFAELSHFSSILDIFIPGDVLVLNETRVSKRRVFLNNPKGRVHEGIFVEPSFELNSWKVLLRNSKKIFAGDVLVSSKNPNLEFKILKKVEPYCVLQANQPLLEEDFQMIGEVPIPPYLKRESNVEDELRYQTVYAKNPGSIAAPTAGFHFTEELLESIRKKDVMTTSINLNIGYGTFKPLSPENFETKSLHEETYSVSKETADVLNLAKKENRRIIAIGTTSLRTLESIYNYNTKQFHAGDGKTDIFITPGDPVDSIDGIVTNFHLPKSSLFLLVCAFAGRDLMMESYHHAIADNFRFFSYGDAMCIMRR